MNIPLLADKSGKISRDYGVYIEEEGITFRGLFIIDTKGNLRQITINDLPVSVERECCFSKLLAVLKVLNGSNQSAFRFLFRSADRSTRP